MLSSIAFPDWATGPQRDPRDGPGASMATMAVRSPTRGSGDPLRCFPLDMSRPAGPYQPPRNGADRLVIGRVGAWQFVGKETRIEVEKGRSALTSFAEIGPDILHKAKLSFGPKLLTARSV